MFYTLIFLSDFNCIKVVIKLDKLYKLWSGRVYVFSHFTHVFNEIITVKSLVKMMFSLHI